MNLIQKIGLGIVAFSGCGVGLLSTFATMGVGVAVMLIGCMFD